MTEITRTCKSSVYWTVYLIWLRHFLLSAWKIIGLNPVHYFHRLQASSSVCWYIVTFTVLFTSLASLVWFVFLLYLYICALPITRPFICIYLRSAVATVSQKGILHSIKSPLAWVSDYSMNPMLSVHLARKTTQKYFLELLSLFNCFLPTSALNWLDSPALLFGYVSDCCHLSRIWNWTFYVWKVSEHIYNTTWRTSLFSAFHPYIHP